MPTSVPRLSVGKDVLVEGRAVTITCIISSRKIMVADPATENRYEVDIDAIEVPVVVDGQELLLPPRKTAEGADDKQKPAVTGASARRDVVDAEETSTAVSVFDTPYLVPVPKIDVVDVAPEHWAKAQLRLDAIRPLLGKEQRTRSDVAARATEVGASTSALYRWLRDYEGSGELGSLLDSKPGPGKGVPHLPPEQDAIMREAIKRYLGNRRLPISDIYNFVEQSCHTNQLPVPARSTLTRRISQLPKPETLRARGQEDLANKLYAPAVATRLATAPMELVQIDHTLADVMLVEERSREVIGRPWVTLAIDVYSRMMAGLHISFDHPCAASVGLCLRNAMFEKEAYLKSLGVTGLHPVYGRIGAVHADNAKEFRGQVVKQACARHGIDVIFRPVKTPNYGGHIEALMGTLAHLTARMPGKTLSNTRDRKGLKPEREASMTLKEFEAYLVDYFVNQYAFAIHSGIGTTPAYMFEGGVNSALHDGRGLHGEAFAPRVPFSAEQKRQLALDLLPFKQCTVQTYGVMVNGLTYHEPVLNPFIRDAQNRGRGKKVKYIVRFDPRDISRVVFFDNETGSYHELGLSRRDIPPFSLWEARTVKAAMVREGLDHRNQVQFFETMARLRRRIEEADERTLQKRDRRHRENVSTARQASAERAALVAAGEPPKVQQVDAAAEPLPLAAPSPAAIARQAGRRLRSDPFSDFGDD